MKISEIIEELKKVQNKNGDIEVISGGDSPSVYAGYISDCGNTYSKYDFDNFPDDYPERELFDLEKDVVCIIEQEA